MICDLKGDGMGVAVGDRESVECSGGVVVAYEKIWELR